MNVRSALLAGLLTIGFVGCGGGAADLPDLGRVSGTITIDEKPMPEVSVTFSPVDGGRSSSAVTDSNGYYELNYNASTKGAVIGTHNVFIAGYVEHDVNDPNAPMVPPPGNVPPDYRKIEKQVQVIAGDNTIDLSYP